VNAVEPRDLSLVVWFDGDCGFCRRVASWLQTQETLVPVQLVAAQRARDAGCPIDLASLLAQLTVTASDGAVYRGTNAWIVVLWALRSHRALALRFATPRWRPWAERLFGAIAGIASWTKRRAAR